jgi:DNA primase
MISKDDINRINDACQIEDVVGDFVGLKKRGTNYIGLCPFHNEKTPSFVVSPGKNIYKCFGCGAAGGSVNFVMQHEQYTYPEALKYLANKYGIELVEKEISPEEKQLEDEKQLIFIVHELAQKYYSNCLLNTDEGQSVGLSYLRNRNISDNAIKKFGIGYSPDTFDGFVAHAISLGYDHEVLKKAGLAVDSQHPIDRFKGRVVFPIYSISGRVLGFGARLMKNDKAAKYLNSPETIIYQKSKILYGLNLAKNSMVKLDNCFIVEGYTDVISLVQAEVENVVASSGTSLTEDQIRLIKRYTSNVTVVFDGDTAGVKAAFRGIDMLLDAAMNVKVLMLPENEDPDSFATTNRDKDIEKYFNENAESFINYKAKFLAGEAGNDPLKKAQIIKDIVQSIARIPDGITRTLFVRECSRIINIPEQILMTEVSKILRSKFAQSTPTQDEQKADVNISPKHPEQLTHHLNNYENLEIRIAGLLVNYCNREIPMTVIDEQNNTVEINTLVYDFIIHSLLKDEYLPKHAFSLEIFKYFNEHIDTQIIPDINKWITEIQDNSIREFIVQLMTSPYTLSPNWDKELNVSVSSIDNTTELLTKEVYGVISHYKLYRIEEELSMIEKKIEKSSDIEEQMSLLKRQSVIKTVMREIATKIGITRID